jgi:hypothetical protein
MIKKSNLEIKDWFVKKYLKVFIFFLLTLIMCSFWLPAAAQTPDSITIENLQISFLPENEHAKMWVVYTIELAPSVSLPDEMSLTLPIDAEILYVTNQIQENQFVSLAVEESVTGGYKELTFSPAAPSIQVAYIDPNLSIQEKQRTFDYQWQSKYPVENLMIYIRQPSNASQISATPDLSPRIDEVEGFVYYTGEFSPVPAAMPFNLSLMYSIQSNAQFDSTPIVRAAAPIDETTPGKTPTPMSVVIWLIIVAMAVVILLGIYYWWFQSRETDESERVVQGVGILNPEKQAVFCHECGMHARSGEHFCSNCGTELRKSSQYLDY